MRHGEYGYDAPYALVIFGSLAALSSLGAAIAWWRMPMHAAAPITMYFVLFLANTTSFFYTTTRGKFLEWERILDRTRLRGKEIGARYGLRPRSSADGNRAQADHGPSDGRGYLEYDRPIG